MTTKPTGAAALLEGLAETLARRLVANAAALEAEPPPADHITRDREVRQIGLIGRTGVTLHRLLAHEQRCARQADKNEAPMNDQPDDSETVERKYVELQNLVDNYTRWSLSVADQGHSTAARAGRRPGQLAPAGERRAA